jgi:negative regulator of sigma E activity
MAAAAVVVVVVVVVVGGLAGVQRWRLEETPDAPALPWGGPEAEEAVSDRVSDRVSDSCRTRQRSQCRT